MKVAYIREKGKYKIITHSNDVIKLLKLKAKYNHKNKTYEAVVNKLPKRSGISFYEHKVTRPNPSAMRNFWDLLEKEKNLMKVRNDMSADIRKTKAEIEEMLGLYGMNLHPGYPEDTQLLGIENRKLHYQKCSEEFIDVEMVEKLAKKHKELKKYIHTVVEVDMVNLQLDLDDLPVNLVRKFMDIETSYRLQRTALINPECVYCGGKVHEETQICNNCGNKESAHSRKLKDELDRINSKWKKEKKKAKKKVEKKTTTRKTAIAS